MESQTEPAATDQDLERERELEALLEWDEKLEEMMGSGHEEDCE